MATTSPWNKTLVKQGWYKRNEIAITPWLFLVPGLIMFAIYVVFPIFKASVSPYSNGMALDHWPHMANTLGWQIMKSF